MCVFKGRELLAAEMGRVLPLLLEPSGKCSDFHPGGSSASVLTQKCQPMVETGNAGVTNLMPFKMSELQLKVLLLLWDRDRDPHFQPSEQWPIGRADVRLLPKCLCTPFASQYK